MNRQRLKNPAATIALILCGLPFAGCHGNTNQTNGGGQALSPAQALAKQQAQLNNPRVSPQMKAMLRKQMQQNSSASSP